MTNNLKSKAVKIQGKDYVLVADRIIFFNENFPNGSITTELVSTTESDKIIIKALVLPDSNKPERKFTGYSQTVIGQGYINKTSALENAETSAVGRALALMGIGVIESIASADEIHKSMNAAPKPVKQVIHAPDILKSEIVKLCADLGCEDKTKEGYEKFVKEKTGFDLKEHFYSMIITRLKSVKSSLEAEEFKKDLEETEPVKEKQPA